MMEARGVSARAPASPRDTWFWGPLAGICILGIAAACLDQPAAPQLAWLSTALNFYGVLAYAGTAVLLFGTLRGDPRRSIVLIAAVSLGMMIFKALATVTLPLTPTLPSIVPANPQLATWMFFLQYAFLKCGALEYAANRRSDAGRTLTGKSIAITTGVVVSIAIVLAICSFALAGDLPVLIAGETFTGLRATGTGWVQLVLSIVVIVALLRVRNRDDIDRAVLLSVITIAVVDLVGFTTLHRYSVGYVAMRILSASAATFVLIAALRRMARALNHMPAMQATLAQTERLAVRQSDRLTAVWRLVNDGEIDDNQRIQAILDSGAVAIRPGVPFFGTLRRVEDDELVVDLVSAAFDNGPILPGRFQRNDRIALNTVFGADIVAADRTIAYSDYGSVEGGARRKMRVNSSQWNSLIGTTFMVANTRYVLSFAALVAMTAEPFTDDDLAFVDVLASFIASRLHHNRQSAQIRYQIEHDVLTGLPTRASFRASASRLIADRVPCAIAVFDLDHFREVNETFGHMIGDAMLVEIGAGLNGARHGEEIVARLGGDNFGVLIDHVTSAVNVEARLQPYRDVFTRPLVTGDRTGREAMFVGASVGVALFPQDAATFADVLAGADSAVDDAKSRQRGSIAFYNQAFEASVQRRRTMRLELANAIDNGQLELYYQPTIEIATGNVAGVEALVRWDHPTLGPVSPGEFIPIAEHNTLIRPIGRWVFRRAMHDITALGILPPAFKIFVNLSGYQLRAPEFTAAMRMHLAERPKAFGHIACDINETVAMQDPDRTLDVMAVLRELGMEIALDDFGTGYSSLSYVTRFPINIIKIDGRFIHRLPGNDHDSALVEVLLGIAQRFGFLTHAEGVESEEQLQWLRERGCTYGQGYHIAKPMDFATLIKWLRTARLMESAAVTSFQPPS
jgi:diguanylate cyclase (GGDEF)-like protein